MKGFFPHTLNCHGRPAQAEPSMRGQMWRTVRTLGLAFLLISGLGALFEEKGLGKGMLANPDMQPQMETKTKFEDVKGVDEAKVWAPNPTSSHP